MKFQNNAYVFYVTHLRKIFYDPSSMVNIHICSNSFVNHTTCVSRSSIVQMSTHPCRWRTAWAVRDLRWHSAVALSISHDWITWARSISLLWIPLFPMLCRAESEYPSLSAPDLPTDYDATLQFWIVGFLGGVHLDFISVHATLGQLNQNQVRSEMSLFELECYNLLCQSCRCYNLFEFHLIV